MKVLHDLDLQLLCRLKNTLLEDTGGTAPASYSSYSGLSNSNVGLICHYDGRIWYYGKATAGSAQWYSAASSGDIPVYANPNRLVVTNGSNLPISSSEFGITSNNLDVGVSGTKRRIVNLNDPISDYDAANKRYVDSMAAGLRDFKDSCVFTTIAATGGTFSAVPVQATITGATITNFDDPGVTVTVGMRVLVKDQAGANKEQNGIYEITAVNAYTYDLQRVLDCNETGELSDGTVVFIEKGVDWDKTTWVITDSGTAPVLNTDDLNWVLFSQVAGIIAGAGLTMTASTIDVNPDNVTIYVTSDQVAVKPATVNSRVLLTATANTNAAWGQLPLANASGYVTGTLDEVNGGLGGDFSSVAKGAVLWFSAVGTISSLAPNFGVGTTLKGLLFNDSGDTVAWTDTTGTGLLTLATSPTFTTSVITGSSSFDVFNTTATTVNAFGAVTTFNVGNVAAGAQSVNMFGASTGASTYNFACGVTANATTKAINIGTSGASGSVTNINVGSSTSGATGTTSFRTAVVVNDGNTGNFFNIVNVADPTKKIAFSAAGISAGTIRTLTIQDNNGTVAYLGNSLGSFAATTSAQLAGVISDEVGTGFLVFGTSPTFTTSVITGSASFDVFNTTATTVNAFGAATTLNVGNASGAQTVTIGGSSTATSTYNFATGVVSTGNTKTLNIGTGGASGSFTSINIGASAGTSNIYVNGVLRPTSLTAIDQTFTIINSVDNTKTAKFDCSGISPATGITFTVQNASGTLALLGNTLNQFAATTSAQLAAVISDETGSGLVVFNNTPALTTPRITTGIDDANSNLMIGFTATGSAVNYLTMTNSASAAAKVYFGTTGTDANVSLQLEPKATTATPSAWGAITWKDAATNSSLQVLRMCRTWGFTLSTGATDRANNALTISSSMTISHEFGTQDIMVMITEVSTGAMVMTDWVKTAGQETRQITLSFKTAPSSGVYRVTVIG